MTDIVSGVIQYLLLRQEVADLVIKRIYPHEIPAGTTQSPTVMPCLTVKLIDEPVLTTFSNKVSFKAKIQIDTWGSSYKTTHGLSDLVFRALQGYRGAMGDCKVGGIFRQRKIDDPEVDLQLERVHQDFLVNYN